MVPASTGIEGSNPKGSKICLELNAIKPKSNYFSIKRIPSPLQCSAEEYGSSFSRAIWYSDSEYSYITISGTASLNSAGKVFHKNNITKQIEITFRIVDEILKSNDFKFTDTIRAYAYVNNKDFRDPFYNYLKIAKLNKKLNFVCSENKVCWENLLFEIELDVVKPNNNKIKKSQSTNQSE